MPEQNYRKKSLFMTLGLLLLSLILIPAVIAQSCPVIVESALESVGNNCARLDRNAACYGFNRLNTVFSPVAVNPEFALPGNRSPLAEIERIEASPLDTLLNEWGIGVLNVQANVPNTLPGQAVIFLILGDTQIESAVDTDTSLESSNVALQVESTSEIEFLEAADFNAPLLSFIPARTQVLADGRSADELWIRVTYDGQLGWVDFTGLRFLDLANSFDDLPIVSDEVFRPMQSFYLSTGIGASRCNQAPNKLVVQGPEGFEIDLQINGANISMGSTVVFDTQTDESTLRAFVLDGTLTTNPHEANEKTFTTGQYTDICLEDFTQNLGLDGAENDRRVQAACDWTEPRPIPLDDLRELLILEQIPDDILHYPIDIPTFRDDCELTELGAYHTVLEGETLSSIATLYHTSVLTLQTANCIYDPNLIIPDTILNVPPVQVISFATNTPIPTSDGGGNPPPASATPLPTATLDPTLPDISIADVSASEITGADLVSVSESFAVTPLLFTVSLSQASTLNVSVDYSATSGTAQSGVDFTANSGTLVIPAGATSGTISIGLLNDPTDEFDETFTVNLSNPINANLADSQAVATIADDDPEASIAISDSAVTEGSGAIAVFTVALSAPSGKPISVDYTTNPVTALLANDFTAQTGTLNFAAGTTSQVINVSITDDLIFEALETFTVDLASSVNATINDAQGIATITDDDPQAQISIADVSVNEIDTVANVTVSLSAASSQAIAVDFTTTNVLASAGADFTAQVGTVNIPAGNTSATITISLLDDTIDEFDETLTVDLSNPSNATILDNQATVTIFDDDAEPELSICSCSVTEGAADVTLTVSVSVPSAKPISVDFAPIDLTASNGDDYTLTAGTLNIPANAASADIVIPILDDAIAEGIEDFEVNLANAFNATILVGTGHVDIFDDESPPVITIDDPLMLEGTGVNPTLNFTVSLSLVAATDVTVDFATANQTASNTSDYVSTANTLTIPAGNLSALIPVTITADAIPEPDETFVVDLTNAIGASIGDSQGIATIQNDDSPPSLSITDATVTEGTDATADLTISLSGISSQDVTVDYSTADNTALEISDYTATSATATILAGNTSTIISIPLVDDSAPESTETFFVNLANPVNATIADTQALITINDTDVCPLPMTVFNATELVQAINAANDEVLCPGADTITLGANITLTTIVTGTTGLPLIGTDITIEGGIFAIIRDGSAPNFRLFYVTSTGILTLNSVVLSDGHATTGGAIYSDGGTVTITNSVLNNHVAFEAGAIFSESGSSLTIQNSVISNNLAASGTGGAIRSLGTLTIDSATFNTNSSSQRGGAIFSAGTLTLSHSSFVSNTATGNQGGAITNTANGTISATTFSNNSANSGGAIFNIGVLTISNSTFSSNNAATDGGAITNDGIGALTRLTHVTIQENSTSAGGSLQNRGSATFELVNSIVANPTIGTACANVGTFTAFGRNLDTDGSCALLSANVSQTNAALLNLQALANNGGASQTHALGLNSVAIDAADQLFCPSSDQRGVARGVDGNGIPNNPATGDCDLGAYEAPAGLAICPLPATANDSFELIEYINLANNEALCSGADTIDLLGITYLLGTTIDGSNGNTGTPLITTAITINGNGAILDGNNENRIFLVNSGSLSLNNMALINGLPSANGGAISLTNASLTTQYTNFEANTASLLGGAIDAIDSTVVLDTALIGFNTAPNAGGGIRVFSSSFGLSSLTLNNSTVKFNSSDQGAGIFAHSSNLNLSNDTITSNNAASSGGGLYLLDSLATAIHTTISQNTASSAGSGIQIVNGSLDFKNSLNADNLISVNCANGAAGVVNVFSSLSSDGSCAIPLSLGIKLQALAYNGGATPTHALGAGSSAIDTADTAFCIGLDQQGVARPFDGDGIVDSPSIGDCDMGAYESTLAVIAPSISIDDPSVSEGDFANSILTFTISLSAVSDFDVDVDYFLFGETAKGAGDDFADAFGTLTIPAGATSATVDVTVTGDAQAEANETLKLLLTNPIHATIADDRGFGTIINDDGCPLPATATTVDELIQYIDSANDESTCPGLDTISLDPRTYILATVIDNSLGDTGLPIITSAISLNGNGATLDGDTFLRIFRVNSGAALNLNDLNLVNGYGGVAGGGAIYNEGTVQIVRSTLYNNTGDNGGAIFNNAGGITVSQTTFITNSASVKGGAIYDNSASSSISSSAFISNRADVGGAVYALTGLFDINNSTFSDNQTDLSGSDAGGAIYGDGGAVRLRHITLAFNASSDGADIAGNATWEIVNSLLVDSIAGANCTATGSVTINSSLTLDGSCSIASSLTVNIQPLALNGGTTLTHALGTGSSAADAADGAFCLAVDQRGSIRGFDANSIPDDPQVGDCDMGAYEAQNLLDAPDIHIAISDAFSIEGEAGSFAVFTVTLSQALARDVTVDYATINQNALADMDYRSAISTLTIPAGQTQVSLVATVLDDTDYETTETFAVVLSNPSFGRIANAQGIATIQDNDPEPEIISETEPTISLADAVVSEQDGQALVYLNLSAPSAETIIVDYVIENGSAIDGQDFVASSGTLTLSAGTTSLPIQIALLEDSDIEGAEFFIVRIISVQHAILGDAEAQVSIMDNEELVPSGEETPPVEAPPALPPRS